MTFMFEGSIVALVTPFDDAGEIDFAALSSLLSFHLESGTSGIVVGGTTGESATLRAGEFQRLMEAVVNEVNGRIPVIAGTGVSATDRTVENTRLAARCGADAALVVTPSYNRPPQRGLIEHFTVVANEGGLPVILYNVPSRTAVDLLPESVGQLCSHEQIVAIKEAVGSQERLQALGSLCSPSFQLLSGDDGTFLRAMRHGAAGVISVAANVVPAEIARICSAALAADWIAAENQEGRLRALFDLLMIETNPIPVKWAMHEMSLCTAQVRLPLITLSHAYHEALRNCLASLDVVK